MNKVQKNKDSAKRFAKDILSKVQDMVGEYNQKVKAMNKNSQRDGKPMKVVEKKGDPRADEEFYMFAADTAEKLKHLNGKLVKTDKINRQRRDNYSNKIEQTVGWIEKLVDNESVTMAFDHNLVKWTQELGNAADEVVTSLVLLEKESSGLCFGGNKNTQYQVQKGLLNIISYSQFWQFLPKCQPQIKKEIYPQYIELNYNQSIFFDIDKMVISQWPQPEIIQLPVQRVVQKVVIRQSSMVHAEQTSFKEEIQLREWEEKCSKMHREVMSQRQLRQAHEMLVGLGRSQNVIKAVQIYKNIPQMSQSQAKESMKSQTQLRINPLICNILGCLYQEGKYCQRDLKKAVEYYIKSASVEDAQGMYKIGKFLQKHMVNSAELFDQQYSSRRQQVKDAIQNYQKAAQKGHLDAITDLAHIYENGIKVNSIREQNSVVSNSQLSNPEDQSFIIAPNIDHAIKYYHIAKKQQFPRALNNLGALYIRQGNKIPETMKGSNVQRGIKYLKKASEQLYPKAFLNLGKCFQNGLGVKLNLEKARGLFAQGAELGDSQCKMEMVKSLINSSFNTTYNDDAKIAQYLRQIIVADQSNSQAQFLMGMLYERGLAVVKSPQNAYHFVNCAAKLDYPPALVKMGDYCYSGYFIDKNVLKSRDYYQKGASKGSSQGYINLGLLYSKGQILQSRSDELQIANKCFLQAAKMGDPNAFIFMNKQISQDKSVVKQAAQFGSTEAIKIMAKTSTTALQTKTISKTKQDYGNILNKYIKAANRPKQKNGAVKRNQAPLSQKERKMMIHSPREKTDISSPIFSVKYNSPQNYRESTTSRQFFRSR